MRRHKNRYIPISAIEMTVYGTAILTVLIGALLATYGAEIGKIPTLLSSASLVSILYMAAASAMIYRNKHTIGGVMTVYFYFVVSIFILISWGSGSATGLLLLGFVIFLTGIIVKAKHIATATVMCILSIFTIFNLHKHGLLLPDGGVLPSAAKSEDIIIYACLLGAFGLVSQLASRYIRRGFSQAHIAEEKLLEQKRNLTKLLKEERAALNRAHIEETRQLYKFAELGQSTVAVLHDLSNHIGVLNFDIEDLSEGSTRTRALQSTRESVKEINNMIKEARGRLKLRQRSENFDITKIIMQAIDEYKSSTKPDRVKIDTSQLPVRKNIIVNGDPVDLAHVVIILVKNAHDACLRSKNPEIKISLSHTKDSVSIFVKDNGKGIPPHIRKHLFEPKNSTKRGGLGIGLYIARHIISSQFKGEIGVKNTSETTFFLRVPTI